jgi:hypothetical protein
MYIKIDHIGEDYAGVYYDKNSINRTQESLNSSNDYHEISLTDLEILKSCQNIIKKIFEN